jgi:glucosamine kinase
MLGSAALVTYLLIGVDGGGSGCRARIFDRDLRPLGEGRAGPANLLSGDGGAAFDAVISAVADALREAGLSPGDSVDCALGAGLAGATPVARARFFARNPPFGVVRLLSDGHAAALGAHGGGDGGVVVLGTGAAASVVSAGAVHEIGGWGFAVDDLGSGADIGRRAVRAALRALDEADHGPSPIAGLAAQVRARHGDVAALVEWAAVATPADFGSLAPLVFDTAERGDAAARTILDGAVAELERLVLLAARHGAWRVAVSGSIGVRLAPHLSRKAAEILVPAVGDACLGAALAVRAGLGWTA